MNNFSATRTSSLYLSQKNFKARCRLARLSTDEQEALAAAIDSLLDGVSLVESPPDQNSLVPAIVWTLSPKAAKLQSLSRQLGLYEEGNLPGVLSGLFEFCSNKELARISFLSILPTKSRYEILNAVLNVRNYRPGTQASSAQYFGWLATDRKIRSLLSVSIHDRMPPKREKARTVVFKECEYLFKNAKAIVGQYRQGADLQLGSTIFEKLEVMTSMHREMIASLMVSSFARFQPRSTLTAATPYNSPHVFLAEWDGDMRDDRLMHYARVEACNYKAWNDPDWLSASASELVEDWAKLSLPLKLYYFRTIAMHATLGEISPDSASSCARELLVSENIFRIPWAIVHFVSQFIH